MKPWGLHVSLDFKESIMATKRTDTEKATKKARLTDSQLRVNLEVNKTALSP